MVRKKTTKCVVRNAVCRLYQGVLDLQNIIQITGTHIDVISFTPKRNVQLSQCQFQ